MKTHGKKYRAASAKRELTTAYGATQAIALVKQMAFAKFDETVEVAIRLGVDPRHADQVVRGTVVLPAGTLKIRNDQYCASMRGMPFEPCFNVTRTSQVSFRGAVSGFGFAYCDFNRRSVRADVVRSSASPRSIRAASATGE